MPQQLDWPRMRREMPMGHSKLHVYKMFLCISVCGCVAGLCFGVCVCVCVTAVTVSVYLTAKYSSI